MKCELCEKGIMHKHGIVEGCSESFSKSPTRTELDLCGMLHRWLTWVSEWGDQDMLQSLVADTIKLLTKGEKT